jgi:hypothetical protein
MIIRIEEPCNKGCLQRYERRRGLKPLMEKYPDLGWPQTKEEMIEALHLLFTKRQIQLYELIHPDLGGLSIEDAAKELGITVQCTYRLKKRMKERYPYAFRYEDIVTEEQKQIANSNRPESEMSKLGHIIGKSKQTAKILGIPYELTDEEYLEVVRMPCFICDKDGWKDSITNDGRHFKYNVLILRNRNEGYVYSNVYAICDKHFRQLKWPENWCTSDKYKRVGF